MESDRGSDPTGNDTSWTLALPDEAATERLARVVADYVGAEDLVTLGGDLGAGKTTFARALIRYMTGDPNLEVPSPTFTFLQTYDKVRELFDAYRSAYVDNGQPGGGGRVVRGGGGAAGGARRGGL